MKSGFKAMPYKISHGNTKRTDPWDETPAEETRYRIVSTETGEVLDDAQGYGYRTAAKAYAAFSYKTRDKSKDEEKRQKELKIKKWMREHKSFVRTMDQFAFEIAKGSWGPDDKFDAKLVKKMLEESGLHPDFTAAELLRVWKKC